MILDIEQAQAFKLGEGWERLTRSWMFDVIAAEAQEHYRLLAYLASQVHDGSMLDLGTSTGLSAWAMTYGNQHRCNMRTYDVSAESREINFEGLPVEVRIESAENIADWRDCRLALLDVGHDGIVEAKIIEAATRQGFRGVMVMDDIRACAPVRDLFWSLKIRNYDLSRYFHWSGTGIVDFSGELAVYHAGQRLIPMGVA